MVGTGNRVEDFGVGFYTKYGDGGVDLSPIAGLNKTQVRSLAAALSVLPQLVNAVPTDGLWDDGRTDESQLGGTYEEMEWAMDFCGDEEPLTSRQKEVLQRYQQLHAVNEHKMVSIPVCEPPADLLQDL